MRTRNVSFITLCTTLLFVGALCTVSVRADAPTADIETAAPQYSAVRYHIFGASLGNGWSGFPNVLAPDYENTAAYELLDVTLPVYLDYELHVTLGANCGGGDLCPDADIEPISPSRALGNESWFDPDELFLYGIVRSSDPEYHDCTEYTGVSLELPLPGTLPFTASGQLRVKDIHGGIGNLTAPFAIQVKYNPNTGIPEDIWAVVFQWDKVQTYTDVNSQSVDAEPGDTVVLPFTFRMILTQPPHSCYVECLYDIWTKVIAVEWPSTDAAGQSPLVVDEDDLAELVDHLSESIVWGFAGDGGQSSRNYHVNFAPFAGSASYIDTADLSAYAADVDKACTFSKAGASEAAAMFDWFGIAATGEMIAVGPNGEAVAEYAVVDWDKARRAIADPSGFRDQLNANPEAAEKSSWSGMKTLYK